jgi:hypothetical protein
MSKQPQIPGLVKVVGSLVLVAAAAWVVFELSPDRGEPANEANMHGLPRDVATAHDQVAPSTRPPEHFPTPLLDGAVPLFSAGGHVAHYDKLVVEVKRDGTLRVLGEQIEVDAFRDMLDHQLDELTPTMVTIQPDDDCIFRHVGPVISVCEEVGIRHTTQPRPSRDPQLSGGSA